MPFQVVFMNCGNWSFVVFRMLRDETEENENNNSLALAQGGCILYGKFVVLKIFFLIW